MPLNFSDLRLADSGFGRPEDPPGPEDGAPRE